MTKTDFSFVEVQSNDLKHEFKITVPHFLYEKRFNERLIIEGKDAKIPGFRPGKAPLPILKQRYGSSIISKVLEQINEDAYKYIINDKKLKPALAPKISLDKFESDQDIELTVTIEVLPEIKPVKLEKLSFETVSCNTMDAQLTEATDKLRQHNRMPGEKQDRAAAKGDIVMIDFKGRLKNGDIIEGGSGDNMPLELGSGSFIPGFEEQLIGAKSNDNVTVNVPFPKDYHAPKLAGQEAIFDVFVREVCGTVSADLNDEFAEKMGLKTLQELKDSMKQQLQNECDKMSMLIAKRHILDYFADTIKFKVPQGLVDLEFESIWQKYKNFVGNAAANDGAQALSTSSEEEVHEKQQYKDIAERRVRLGLLLADVGRQYEVMVTKQELEKALMETALSYKGHERQAFDYLRNNKEALEGLRASIFEENVIKLILDKAQKTVRELSFSDMQKEYRELIDEDDHDDHSAQHGEEGHVHGPDCQHDH